MNKTTEALKLAEEALDFARGSHGVMLMSNPPQDAWVFREVDFRINAALAAIREALADQEERMVGVEKYDPVKQEPVAWMADGQLFTDKNFVSIETPVPLYAAPVDAKAIRAEALEEAAWLCQLKFFLGYRVAAAIRGLK